MALQNHKSNRGLPGLEGLRSDSKLFDHPDQDLTSFPSTCEVIAHP